MLVVSTSSTERFFFAAISFRKPLTLSLDVTLFTSEVAWGTEEWVCWYLSRYQTVYSVDTPGIFMLRIQGNISSYRKNSNWHLQFMELNISWNSVGCIEIFHRDIVGGWRCHERLLLNYSKIDSYELFGK